jgi:phosphate transport system substrate-binding protein
VNTASTKLARLGTIGAIALASTILLSSCAANESATPTASATPSNLSGTFSGSGSSAQGAAQTAWIAAFQTANPKVTVNYDPAGSGAGRKAFIAGGVAFAGSDSALSDAEIAAGFAGCNPTTGYVEVPSYISPIAIIFNVKGISTLNLDANTIAGIFKGTITTWNDPAIAATNKGVTLPATTINSVHRSDDSGTTANFTDYLSQAAPTVWDAKPAQKFPYAVGDAAQGTSGVVDAVTNGTDTIGYADASKAGKLGIVSVGVGTGFAAPTADAAAAVVAASTPIAGRAATDLAIKINRVTTDPTHYPIVLVSYLITCTSFVDPTMAPLVSAYFSYVTGTDGQATAASSAGSAPLTADASAKIATAIAAIK